MQAAEDGEEESYDEGQRDAKERGEHLVDEVFTDLIHGRAADPHFIKAVRGVRLCYHILKGQLQYKRNTQQADSSSIKGTVTLPLTASYTHDTEASYTGNIKQTHLDWACCHF